MLYSSRAEDSMATWFRNVRKGMQASAAHGRALKLKRQGRVSEARDVLANALARIGPPDSGEGVPLQVSRLFLLWMLGDAAEQLGQRELARESYEQFLALAARVPEAARGHRGERQKIDMEQWARQALERLRAPGV